jgi:hypothetical protein
VLPAYGPLPVAQHCVAGADWLLKETGDKVTAAAFLLHDAHEALINDWPTPAVDALAAVARAEFAKSSGYPADHIVKAALKTLKFNLDTAIYRAAGLPWPLPPIIRGLVHKVDIRMLNAERRLLMAPAPHPWADVIEAETPLPVPKKALIPWPWERAAEEYRIRLRAWCPPALPH